MPNTQKLLLYFFIKPFFIMNKNNFVDMPQTQNLKWKEIDNKNSLN